MLKTKMINIIQWLIDFWDYPTGFVLSIALFYWANIVIETHNIFPRFVAMVLASIGVYTVLKELREAILWHKEKNRINESLKELKQKYDIKISDYLL